MGPSSSLRGVLNVSRQALAAAARIVALGEGRRRVVTGAIGGSAANGIRALESPCTRLVISVSDMG